MFTLVSGVVFMFCRSDCNALANCVGVVTAPSSNHCWLKSACGSLESQTDRKVWKKIDPQGN